MKCSRAGQVRRRAGRVSVTRKAAVGAGLAALALTVCGPVAAQAKAPTGCAGRLYAVNSYGNTVSVINTNTNTVLSTIPVGKAPAWAVISPDQKLVYVVSTDVASISEISTATNKVVRVLHTDPMSVGVAFTPDGKKLVVSYITGKVRILTVATGQFSAPIRVGLDPEQIRISPDGKYVYAASTLQGIYKVDIAAEKVVDVIPTKAFGEGALPFTYNLIISRDGGTIYVANIFANAIAVIDTRTDAVIRTWKAQGPVGLQLSLDGKSLFVSNFWAASLDEYDIATGTLVRSTGRTAIRLPSHVAESADGKLLYVGQSFNSKLMVVNAASMKPVKTLTVGLGPNSLAVCNSASPR